MLYADYQDRTAPPWATGRNFSSWWQAHGLLKDACADAARVATKASWPKATPEDALPFIGQDRSLPRVPSDTEATYRATLQDARNLWAYGGTEQGVLAAITRRFPGSSPTILEYWDNPSFFGIDDTRWARFALFLTLSTWGAPPNWGDPGVDWGDPNLVWGVSAPQGEVAELFETIRTWRPGHTVCTKVVVTTPDGDIELIP